MEDREQLYLSVEFALYINHFMWSVECLSSGNHICTNDYISQLYTWYYTGSVTCSCTRYCPLSISQENHKGECLQSDDLEQVWLPVITWPQTGVAVLCHINNKWDTWTSGILLVHMTWHRCVWGMTFLDHMTLYRWIRARLSGSASFPR